MPKIEYEGLSDRDLLVLVVNACNDMRDHLKKLNDKIAVNESRIAVNEEKFVILETKEQVRITFSKRQVISWGGLAVGCVTAVVVVVSKLIELWW